MLAHVLALAAAQTQNCIVGWKWDGAQCVVDDLGQACPNGVTSIPCEDGRGLARVNGTLKAPADRPNEVLCWRIECPGQVVFSFEGGFKTGCRQSGPPAVNCTDGTCNTFSVTSWRTKANGFRESLTATGCGGFGISDSPPKFEPADMAMLRAAVVRLDTSVHPNVQGQEIVMHWEADRPVDGPPPTPPPSCQDGWTWSGSWCQPGTLGAACASLQSVTCATAGGADSGSLLIPAGTANAQMCWNIECGGPVALSYPGFDLGDSGRCGVAEACSAGTCNTFEVRGWTLTSTGTTQSVSSVGCGAAPPQAWGAAPFPNGAVLSLNTTKHGPGVDFNVTWACKKRADGVTTATCDPNSEPEGVNPTDNEDGSDEDDKNTFMWIALVVFLAFLLVACMLWWYYFRLKKHEENMQSIKKEKSVPDVDDQVNLTQTQPYEELDPAPRDAAEDYDPGNPVAPLQRPLSGGRGHYVDGPRTDPFAAGCEVEFQCGREWRSAEIVQTLSGDRVVVQAGAMSITLPRSVVRKRGAPAPPTSEAYHHKESGSPSRGYTSVNKVTAY
eukprot:TRINITY_DN4211_c1_g1_i1.p1 TRINITY_DN4211_c1_g1~~TRINITY_DN4211_c1_g1_i1.p1  ORF type:complete len:556 (+),score=130.28 TRINITY_DN4211_c1_g1_i1:141-1808(+)